jgi:hypothetical protein
MTWKKYEDHPFYNIAYYQKKVYEDVFAEIIDYGGAYEVESQISSDGEHTINIQLLGYAELDFDAMEKDIVKIIKKLK